MESPSEKTFVTCSKWYRHLTVGNKYKVVGWNMVMWLIINDNNEEKWYDKTLFDL